MSATCRLTLLVFLSAPAAALADVTPREVWQSWQDRFPAFGLTLSPESEIETDGTLVLRDVAVSLAQPGASVGGTLPEIALREVGDGTVGVSLSPEFAATLGLSVPGGVRVDGTMTVSAPGLEIIASGTADMVQYAVAAPVVSVALALTGSDGTDVAANLALQDPAAALRMMSGAGGDARAFEYDFSARQADGVMTLAPPTNPNLSRDSDVTATFTMGLADLGITTVGDVAALASDYDILGRAAGDAWLSSAVRHGAQTFAVTLENPRDGAFTFSGGTGSGSMELGRAGDMLRLGLRFEDHEIAMTGDHVPLSDVRLTSDLLAFRMTAPVVPTEQPVPFTMGLDLAGVAVSEALWGFVDPEGALSREPADLNIDLAGQARVLRELSIARPLSDVITAFGITGLEIEDARLALSGAALSADGALTFDLAAPPVYGSLPAPSGAVTVKLTGGNALLDDLVQANLLPQGQAMFTRLMLGLFATPAEGDTLTTNIELRPDGAILANGQRLK